MVLARKDTLKAATLMETIVAMVVLMIVFFISTMVIQNVLQNVRIGTKVKAYFALEQLLEDTQSQHKFFDEELTKEQYVITKSISNSPLSDSLLVVTLEAKNSKGDRLSYIRQTIRKYE